MFIRIKTTPNSPRKSIQIVESVRDSHGKVKQKIVRHVGVALNEKELKRMRDLAEFIKAEIEAKHQPYLFSPEEMALKAIECRKKKGQEEKAININLKKLREEQRTIVGIHEVYGRIYDELSFNKAISQPVRNRANSILLRHVVMARIANPRSKRETVNMLEREFGMSLSLEKVYRMMDKLDDDVISRIQKLSGGATQKVLGEKINVLFYDCTTLYFESFKEDDLKQNGYSKDMKFNQPQVILGLLATEAGLPIGYEVFPGASFEGHTLVPILKQLQKRYELKQIIFVADRGMLSEENLRYLEKNKLNYIVGARLRNVTKKLQKEIIEESNYQPSTSESFNRIGFFQTQQKRKLIVSYSKNRAQKDKHDREKAIEKLMAKITQNDKDPKSLLNNYGYKKYLTIEGETTLKINEEKLSQESQWDGLHGIITNIEDMAAESILLQYRNLWQIEECFRVNKHDLRIRPIFHWTPRRIRAHIAIAYIAFTCVRHLEYRVQLQYKKMSPEAIRQELIHVQLSFLKHQETDKHYCIPSNVSLEAKKIYQVMGLKLSTIPFEITSKENKK